MGKRKVKRIVPPPQEEMLVILRAADGIIGQGGRSQLSKILKGSKDKKLLELGLDRNPAYGALKEFTLEQILEKIDQMLAAGLLDTEMNWKIPVIVFTPLGWLIERERYAEELLREWDQWLTNNIEPISMEYLKDRNRGMIFLFLYKILCTADKKYIPLLKLWANKEYKKVRAAIEDLIHALEKRESLDDKAWELLKQEKAATLLMQGKDPIFTVCHLCDRIFIINETDPKLYEHVPLRIPEICPNCLERQRKS